MAKGKFIVIEGTDGSGKTIQTRLLLRKLKNEKIDVRTLDFPRYRHASSYFVRQYLNGCYGDWREVGAYRASIFYALDRFAASAGLKKWLAQGKTVIANRYVASNFGHQGVKIKNKAARKQFFNWVSNLEYNVLSIPKPDLNIFLHMPSSVAYKLISLKGKREYLGAKKRDIHEKDISHLKQAEKVFLEVAEFFPDDFAVVECVKKGKLLSVEEIGEDVWKTVQRILEN